MLIDLHNHTWPRSHDSVLDPEDLVVRAKALGLDGICLTEHDNVWNPAEAAAIAEKHDFLVIPGVEVSTDDGHILAYGVDKYVFGMHRVGRLAEHVKQRGGGLVVAHPYRRAIPWKDDPGGLGAGAGAVGDEPGDPALPGARGAQRPRQRA